MLLNATTAISTPKVLLVPYSKWHVPRYHEWMKDPTIQQATASEPLTLEEEYAMQTSWRNDADKLTFIICRPVSSSSPEKTETKKKPETMTELDAHADTEPNMLGDINLFLRVDDGEDGSSAPSIVGEIELMIAETRAQGNGYGRGALLAFLRFVREHEVAIVGEFVEGDEVARNVFQEKGKGEDEGKGEGKGVSALSVKIGKENERSLRLFESVGFRRVGAEPNYFGEWELRRELQGEGQEQGQVDGYREMRYTREE
ncbi:N-acetyltransferase [Aspergillus egyptiacus]|nr:N-acetyltransferase [Aspergillus egyptiacus]